MNNPDILQLILSRVDNNTLGKLASITLWTDVKPVLQSNYFWYLRSQELVGRSLIARMNIDWKEIYHILEAVKLNVDITAINSLAAVEVVTEAFGSSIWTSSDTLLSPWLITNAPALKYLLDNSYITASTESACIAAKNAGERGSQEVIDLLLTLLGVSSTEILTAAITGTIRGDKLELYLYLCGLGNTIPKSVLEVPLRMTISKSYIFLQVARRGGPRIAEYLLQSDIDPRELYQSILLTIIHGLPEVLRLIYEKKPNSKKLLSDDTYKTHVMAAAATGQLGIVKILVENSNNTVPHGDILNSAILGGRIEVVKYALTLVSPASDNNQALMNAMGRGGIDIIRLLLEDSRIDPNPNLRGIIFAAHRLKNEDLVQIVNEALTTSDSPSILELPGYNEVAEVDLIIRDERIDVERMDIPTLRLVFWSLGRLLTPAIRGFVLGNNLAGGSNVPEDEQPYRILSAIEERCNSAYSTLLRFLIIKRPEAEEFFRWLDSMEECRLILEATKSSLNGRLACLEEAIPLRELMLTIVQQSMTLEESYCALQREGVTQETILLSCRLVGTYIGYRDATSLVN